MTPDQIAQFKQLLGSTDASGRSPIKPRQLHDLRLMPTATDPRPTFFWSAEAPRDVDTSRTTPYPRLLWHKDTGAEITVQDEDEEIERGTAYVRTPPTSMPIDPADELKALWESLSPADQQLVLDSQAAAKRKLIEEKMAALPADRLAALLDAEAARAGGQKKKGAA
jgi:hypothetical protein